MSGSISALSAILRIVLREMSKLEGKHSQTERLASALSKMWVVQFVNVGCLLFLINSRFPDNSWLAEKIQLPEEIPFLQGVYDDFYANWYTVVGVSIATTCFFDSVSPIPNCCFWLQAGCIRCNDRGCTCNNAKTKQVIQEEYEMMYRGAEF